VVSFSSPAGRDVVRDDAPLVLPKQIRAFEVDKPAGETLQAPVAEAVQTRAYPPMD
jgi:hypothetical protein